MSMVMCQAWESVRVELIAYGIRKVRPIQSMKGIMMSNLMKELEQFLNVEAEWVLERLSTGTESNDRNYYQGRLDQLAQVRRLLNLPQIMRERVSNGHTRAAN